MGEIDVLSVGQGHTKIEINDNPEDIEKARTIIEDMLKRGYSIFVETPEGDMKRVKRFDAKKMTYLIDPPEGETVQASVPVKKAKATSVGRSAGG